MRHSPLFQLLLRLYPPEVRDQLSPRVEAALFHPNASALFAAAKLIRHALFLRGTSPGPYILAASILFAAASVAMSASVTLTHLSGLLQPRMDSPEALYSLLFFAVFLTVASVLLLAIHWLQKCSKSRI
ncbi:MAG: hypothetical protein JNM66_07855 [Bryobacterales bacterium]|nr:hypothetical protein [Bryobacterales bacterium]